MPRTGAPTHRCSDAEIVVLVKQVPDTNARIAIAGGAVDMTGVKMVMSPYDEFAHDPSSQGSPGQRHRLDHGRSRRRQGAEGRKAIGADLIVRLDHDGWLDSSALQSAIAAALTDLGAEVCCGKSAADTGAGSGPGLAGRASLGQRFKRRWS